MNTRLGPLTPMPPRAYGDQTAGRRRCRGHTPRAGPAAEAASVGALFHFKPSAQCRLLANFVAEVGAETGLR